MALFAPVPLIDSSTLKLWALFAGLFQFKLIANTLLQGRARMKAGVVCTQEDATVFGRGKLRAGEDGPEATRVGWLWENDVENIPFFLFLSLGFVLTGGQYEACLWLFTTYFVTRMLHAVTLLKAVQPWRAIFYFIGLVVCVIMAVGMIGNFFA